MGCAAGFSSLRIQTNLLPSEIRTECMVKAKKPWAAAAAAILLLGIGAMAAKAYWGETRPWGMDTKNKAAAKNDTNPVTQWLLKSDEVNAKVAKGRVILKRPRPMPTRKRRRCAASLPGRTNNSTGST